MILVACLMGILKGIPLLNNSLPLDMTSLIEALTLGKPFLTIPYALDMVLGLFPILLFQLVFGVFSLSASLCSQCILFHQTEKPDQVVS